jgi:hypothetical protein
MPGLHRSGRKGMKRLAGGSGGKGLSLSHGLLSRVSDSGSGGEEMLSDQCHCVESLSSANCTGLVITETVRRVEDGQAEVGG